MRAPPLGEAYELLVFASDGHGARYFSHRPILCDLVFMSLPDRHDRRPTVAPNIPRRARRRACTDVEESADDVSSQPRGTVRESTSDGATPPISRRIDLDTLAGGVRHRLGERTERV